MTSDLREAAERLRRHYDGGRFDYAKFDSHPMQALAADWEEVALAYLAENPADGEEAVTEAWLRSVFTDTLEGFAPCLYLDPQADDIDIPRRAIVVNVKSASLVDANNIDRVWLHLTDWQTRADVRRLAAALGITLKEPTHV